MFNKILKISDEMFDPILSSTQCRQKWCKLFNIRILMYLFNLKKEQFESMVS